MTASQLSPKRKVCHPFSIGLARGTEVNLFLAPSDTFSVNVLFLFAERASYEAFILFRFSLFLFL